jgi:hypothetical protein
VPVRVLGPGRFCALSAFFISQGDLLYARTSGSYAVGDVAVYRIPKGTPGAGALVVHRIRRILPNGTYLFQGDNKPAPDDVTPTRADLVARPVLDLGDIPTRALILAPLVFTIVAGGAVVVALWPAHDEVDATQDDDPDIDGDGDADVRTDATDARDAVGPSRRDRRRTRRPWGPRPVPFETPERSPAPDPARIG